MHHRKFRSRGGDWAPCNIVGLCSDCHREVTNDHTNASHVRGLAVHSYEDPTEVAVLLWHCADPLILDNDGNYTPVGDSV